MATKCWWNYIYKLPLNGRTSVRDFLKFPQFLKIPGKIVAPPNYKLQVDGRRQLERPFHALKKAENCMKIG